MKKQKYILLNILPRLTIVFFLFLSFLPTFLLGGIIMPPPIEPPTSNFDPALCQHISGSGPLKIVFLKDETLLPAYDGIEFDPIYDFSTVSEAAINGFETIEPYKTYFSQFSFYAYTENYFYDSISEASSATVSSYVKDSKCGNDVFEYVWFVKDIEKGSYTMSNFNTVFISVAQFDPFVTQTDSIQEYFWRGGFPEAFMSDIAIGRAVIHEISHAKAGLRDEYVKSSVSSADVLYSGSTNCSPSPESGFKSTIDNKVYGLTDRSGCSIPSQFRSSQTSIMKEGWAVPKFNVVSCGYVISSILDEPIEKAYAETHWADCCNMDTVRGGIPGCAPTVSTTTVTLDFPVSYSCPVAQTSTLSFPPISNGSILSNNAIQNLSSSLAFRTDYLVNFFNINTKDVSTTTTDGIKAIPKGDLAYIPAGSSTVFEMDIPYCVSARVDLQKSITSTSSPITSIGGVPTGSDYIVSSSTLQLEFPADNNCPASFLNSTTLPASATTTVISAMWDIDLPFIPGGETNVFKINGKDVSTTTTDGAKLIPAGDLASIPANTAVKFETYTRYCDESDYERFTLQFRTTTGGPISCFLNCL